MKPIIAANWKMNLTKSAAVELINSINGAMETLPNIELIIGPHIAILIWFTRI